MKAARYYWEGLDVQGNKRFGIQEAFKTRWLKAQLSQQGIKPILITKVTATKAIKLASLCQLFQQLADLLAAGIPLAESLQLLIQHQSHQALRMLMTACAYQIAAGQPLSHALSHYPQQFSHFDRHLIYLGEQAGHLEHTLGKLAHYHRQRLQFKQQLKTALIYPCLVLTLGGATLLLMITKIIPQFAALFSALQVPLPKQTQWVLHFASSLQQSLPLFLLSCAGVGISIWLLLHYQPRLKNCWDKQLLKFPLLGSTLHLGMLARSCYCLATASAAGINLISALQLTADLQHNHYFQQRFQAIVHALNQGKPLIPLLHQSGLFPNFSLSLLATAEASGQFTSGLERLSHEFEQRFKHHLTHLSHLLEPLFLVILSILVGSLIIAMYLPIFQLGTQL